jgi:hypothetical protein
MTIAYPGYTQGPFGMPANDTERMMMMLQQSSDAWAKALQQRRQNDALNSIMGPQEVPGQSTPQGVQRTAYQQPTNQQIAQQVLTSPNISPQQKQQTLQNLVYAEQMKPKMPEIEYETITWYDQNGKSHKQRVPKQATNKFFEWVESRGGTYDKPEKDSKGGFTEVTWYDSRGKSHKSKVPDAQVNSVFKQIEAAGGSYDKPEKPKTESRLNAMKADAWEAELKGNATDAQKRMIEQDVPPLIGEALRAVLQNPASLGMDDKELSKKIRNLSTWLAGKGDDMGGEINRYMEIGAGVEGAPEAPKAKEKPGNQMDEKERQDLNSSLDDNGAIRVTIDGEEMVLEKPKNKNSAEYKQYIQALKELDLYDEYKERFE